MVLRRIMIALALVGGTPQAVAFADPQWKSGCCFGCNGLEQFDLRDLRLAAVVKEKHPRQSRALLITQAGQEVYVKVGDRISKSQALVQRIMSDGIIVLYTTPGDPSGPHPLRMSL